MAEASLQLQRIGSICRQGRCEEAIAALEEITLEHPGAAELRYQLGVCFSGVCRPHSLVDREIALEYFRAALSSCGPESPVLLRAQILGALGNSYLNSLRLPRPARLAAAIECYEKAAAIYQTAGLAEDWAREENNLGLAKSDLAATEPSRWVEAVDHFRRALVVRAALPDRERYAATLENLGAAYRSLPNGDRRTNTWRAVSCYCRALRIYRAARYPVENAAVHNNLGNAYVSIPARDAGEKDRHVRRALRHFERALRVRTKQAYPRDYAVTQFNRGQAFLERRGADPRESLQQAAECFREALEGFERCGEASQARQARQMVEAVRGWLPAAA
jgi:tetratricopeptide (TPR) repeat protein